MKEQYFPKSMRFSLLRERERFYREEFNLEKAGQWFQGQKGKAIFAVIIGRHTHIFLEKYREDAATTIVIDEYLDLEDVRRLIIEFLPESVYYDRNVYGEEDKIAGQELAFDLDPENVVCPIHGSLADKMKGHQGLSFCELELRIIKEHALHLYEYLHTMFSSVRVVYSGRGYHIHVFDEIAYRMTPKERRRLARTIKLKGFPIDEWVTTGEMRLLRLPYSLNGIVSRTAIPLEGDELESFDPVTDNRCRPKFLGQ